MNPNHNTSQARLPPPQRQDAALRRSAAELFLFAATLIVCWTATPPPSSAAESLGPPGAITEFQASSTCATCHEKIVGQHNESMHAKSFSNPVFQAQYVRELVPLIQGENQSLSVEADKCLACHDPINYLKKKGRPASAEQADPKLSGVVCDLCHRITGYKGGQPGGGNFIATPGQQKLGPFEHSTDWHHAYHALQTQSQLCGICHNDTNHNGLEIKSTYSEWKNSSYAAKKIECQDCHMSIKGSLTDGKAKHESGQAATKSFAFQAGHDRSTLYTHRFPGAHSKTQVKDAIQIKMSTEQEAVSPGDEVAITLEVTNKKAGHSLPSGSTDLRMLWLELSVLVNGESLPIPAAPGTANNSFDVAGQGAFDQDILGKDVPEGCRMYRSIFVSADHKQTLSSYNATRLIFDNRLKANERRRESYTCKIPQGTKESVTFLAKINYLRYPSSFADALHIARTEPITMASAHKKLPLK